MARSPGFGSIPCNLTFNATSDRDTRQFVLEQLTQLGTVLRTLPTGEIEILPPPLPDFPEEEPYRLRL